MSRCLAATSYAVVATYSFMDLRRLLPAQIMLVCLLALASGCSSSYNTGLLRAEQFEHQGDFAAALTLYERTLPRIPSSYRRQVSSAHLHAGGCALKLHRFKEAFAHYQKAVDADDTNLDAQLHLAELFVMGGLPQQGLSQVEVVLHRQPENAAALFLLGSITAAAGNPSQAIVFFEHSLNNDPTRENTAIALAELYNRVEKVGQARAVLLRASAANTHSWMAALALGRLEEQEGRSQDAENAYRTAVAANDSAVTNQRLALFLQRAGRIPEAEEVLRHIDSLRPASTNALADFQLVSGRPDAALQSYKENLQPRTLSATEPPLAATVSRLIEAELQSASTSGDALSKSAEDSKHLTLAHSLLDEHRQILDEATIAILECEIALAEGNISKAETQVMIAMARAPESASAHYVRGLVFKLQDKVAEAKAEWNTALELDAEHVPSHIAMAGQCLSDKDAATADEQISSVVRDEPGNVAALNLYARVLLAEGRLGPARGILGRSLALDRNRLESQVILGDIEVAQQRYGLALIAYQKALLTHPDSSQALSGLLNLYRKGTINRSVLQQMEKVADASPSSAWLMEITGRLYEEHGWHADAVRALSRAVEIDAQRASAALALTNVYYAKGNSVLANQTVLASRSIGSASPGATAMIAAAKAQEQGDNNSAIRNYEAAIKHGEPSGAAANNLAWIYAQQGTRLDRALKLALSAVERNPKDAAILDTLGVVYLKRHDYSAAAETLKKAVSLSENRRLKSTAATPERLQSQLYQHLAAAYSGAGMTSEAAVALLKVRSL